jgi:hypothetical protein
MAGANIASQATVEDGITAEPAVFPIVDVQRMAGQCATAVMTGLVQIAGHSMKAEHVQVQIIACHTHRRSTPEPSLAAAVHHMAAKTPTRTTPTRTIPISKRTLHHQAAGETCSAAGDDPQSRFRIGHGARSNEVHPAKSNGG